MHSLYHAPHLLPFVRAAAARPSLPATARTARSERRPSACTRSSRIPRFRTPSGSRPLGAFASSTRSRCGSSCSTCWVDGLECFTTGLFLTAPPLTSRFMEMTCPPASTISVPWLRDLRHPDQSSAFEAPTDACRVRHPRSARRPTVEKCTAYGIRTRVTAVKGRRPRPLDERGV